MKEEYGTVDNASMFISPFFFVALVVMNSGINQDRGKTVADQARPMPDDDYVGPSRYLFDAVSSTHTFPAPLQLMYYFKIPLEEHAAFVLG